MPNFVGESIEEAIQKGLNALSATKEQVKVQVIEEEKKGFLGIGKRAATVSVEFLEKEVPVKEKQPEKAPEKPIIAAASSATNEHSLPELKELNERDAITQLSLYLTNVTKEMGAPALIRVEQEAELLIFHLDSQNSGALIGKHGRILNALQYLAQVFAHRVAQNKLNVVINVGDYREKRKAVLQRLAERTAHQVKTTGQPVFLEPMPAFERKQIHAVLSKDPYIKTHSEGNDPYRYLIVEPEENVL